MRILDIAKTIFGIIYLLGALINLMLALINPQIYREFASLSIMPLYKTLWKSMVIPHLRIWLILVVVFEITIGSFILSKRNLANVGLMGGIIFNLFLIPFWWSGFALINVLFVLIQILLLRGKYGSKE
jgi:chromate transport protein ChrA